MKFVKEQGLSFWLNAAAVITALVGTILLLVTNGVTGYKLTSAGLAITLAVLAVVAVAASVAISVKLGSDHIIVTALNLVVLVFAMVVVCALILDRSGILVAITSYDSSNVVAKGVIAQSIASIVFMLITVVLLIVGAFLAKAKKQA